MIPVKFTKDMRETIAHVVNSAAAEARSIVEFHWIKMFRLENSTLPKVFIEYMKRKAFTSEMWILYQQKGMCLSAENLRLAHCGLEG